MKLWAAIFVFSFLACLHKDVTDANSTAFPVRVNEIPLPAGFVTTAHSSTFASGLGTLKLCVPASGNDTTTLSQNTVVSYALLRCDSLKLPQQKAVETMMRLRAEYLYHARRFDEIQFFLSGGEHASFLEYASGLRPVVMNSRVKWVKAADSDTSYKGFLSYLKMVFAYSGASALRDHLLKIDAARVKAGDLLISQNGNCSAIVLAVARNANNGKRKILLAMNSHDGMQLVIPVNTSLKNSSPWFDFDNQYGVRTPYCDFNPGDLRSWN